MIAARPGTKTRRREARMEVRHALGTSRDGAPGVRAALRAAAALGRILNDASGGRYRLRVEEDGVILGNPDDALYRFAKSGEEVSDL